jgi:hypothetical protein
LDKLYNGTKSPQRNIEKVVQILGAVHQFLIREPTMFNGAFDYPNMREDFRPDTKHELVIDVFRANVLNDFTQRPDKQWYTTSKFRAHENPLQAQDFVRLLAWPLAAQMIWFHHHPVQLSPVENCLCLHTPQNYVRLPVAGEVIEQLCIVEWRSKKDRANTRKKKPDWWHSAYHTQIRQAEERGEMSDVEHWETILERWEPETQTAKESDNPASRLRRFLQSLLPWQSTIKGEQISGTAKDWNDSSSSVQ